MKLKKMTHRHESESEGSQSDSDDPEKESLSKAAKLAMKGVIPKDSEKKEMLSFIAYAVHLENTCKLLTQSK